MMMVASLGTFEGWEREEGGRGEHRRSQRGKSGEAPVSYHYKLKNCRIGKGRFKHQTYQ